jgi:hypothetical protein
LLTVLRLIIAIPVMIGVFLALVLALLLVAGWSSARLGLNQDTEQAFALPIYATIFALGSFVSIMVGAALAPRRLAALTIGMLSVNLVLPLVALALQEVLASGEAGYDGRGMGEILGAGLGAFLAHRAWGRRRQRRAAPALSNRANLVILAASALLLLLPVRSITVPAWRVGFVDRAEQPLASLAIKQSWADFSVEGQVVGHEEVAATDAQGFVAFPERVLWAPVALRLWGPVRNLLTAFIHASSGRYASLTPLCPLRAVDPERTYYLGQSLAEQVHLAEAEGSIVSDNADCQRLIEQARRARMAR